MPQHKIFTADIVHRLRANGEASLKHGRIDHLPVVKVFCPYSTAVWLFVESDPTDPDHLYGLADNGKNPPELGPISRVDIEDCTIRVAGSYLPLERDANFCPQHPLSVYTRAARRAGRIVENTDALDNAAAQIWAERERSKATPETGWQDWPASP